MWRAMKIKPSEAPLNKNGIPLQHKITQKQGEWAVAAPTKTEIFKIFPYYTQFSFNMTFFISRILI